MDIKTILIVDDDERLQELYKNELKKADYRILQSLTGKNAYQEVLDLKPDLVLLDVMLPDDGNGFEILKQMKKDPVTRNVPVIMLTNLPDEQTVAKAVGATDYLVKADTTIEALKKKIKKYL